MENIKCLQFSGEIPFYLPTRGSEYSAGLDIHATCNVVVKANDRALISTNLAMEIPNGYYGRLASRSGLASKHGIEVGAGVIDSDYRGEIKVLLFNRTAIDYNVTFGDKIAQLIIEPYLKVNIVQVDSLTNTSRGSGGFGSTGK